MTETPAQRLLRIALDVCTEKEIEAMAAYLEHGSKRSAARAMNLPRSTFQSRLDSAARKIRGRFIEGAAA